MPSIEGINTFLKWNREDTDTIWGDKKVLTKFFFPVTCIDRQLGNKFNVKAQSSNEAQMSKVIKKDLTFSHFGIPLAFEL